MSEPVPPGLYTEPPLGQADWLPGRRLQASDPTVLSTGQVIPRDVVPGPGGGDAFTVGLDTAPTVLRELRAARDELQQVRSDAFALGTIDPGSQDEVSRDTAIVLGAVATGGTGSLIEAVDGGIRRLGELIDAIEAELAAYWSTEQANRGRLA
ncbi:hypothetical protein [Actinomycetospora termitidis]|uniref:Uncharacterized protein n=1 Tax=Actinomycetospora termitidis TaxID=3053470 RepID=A0ABT7MGJ0_9PSEU|nr:hypothetical protein [Actinomycetospora sp. Odt1-22]MDL5159284.1 hypothetical protein [Actinomycetospora sp. Odt1-22]